MRIVTTQFGGIWQTPPNFDVTNSSMPGMQAGIMQHAVSRTVMKDNTGSRCPAVICLCPERDVSDTKKSCLVRTLEECTARGLGVFCSSVTLKSTGMSLAVGIL